MTYPSDTESAMELPKWMKLMRGLVIALLCVSILAMAAVGWAAFRIVGSALSPEIAMPEQVNLPPQAEPQSLTQMKDGDFLVIYKVQDQYYARIVDANGREISEMAFQ